MLSHLRSFLPLLPSPKVMLAGILKATRTIRVEAQIVEHVISQSLLEVAPVDLESKEHDALQYFAPSQLCL